MALEMTPCGFGGAARLALRFTTFRPLSFTVLRLVLRLAFFVTRFLAGLRVFLRAFAIFIPLPDEPSPPLQFMRRGGAQRQCMSRLRRRNRHVGEDFVLLHSRPGLVL